MNENPFDDYKKTLAEQIKNMFLDLERKSDEIIYQKFGDEIKSCNGEVKTIINLETLEDFRVTFKFSNNISKELSDKIHTYFINNCEDNNILTA